MKRKRDFSVSKPTEPPTKRAATGPSAAAAAAAAGLYLCFFSFLACSTTRLLLLIILFFFLAAIQNGRIICNISREFGNHLLSYMLAEETLGAAMVRLNSPMFSARARRFMKYSMIENDKYWTKERVQEICDLLPSP